MSSIGAEFRIQQYAKRLKLPVVGSQAVRYAEKPPPPDTMPLSFSPHSSKQSLSNATATWSVPGFPPHAFPS